MKKSRYRGPRPTSLMAVLLAAMMSYPEVGAGTPGKNRFNPVLEECIRAPTVPCVIALAINTAEVIGDADERAWAFIRTASAQRAAGDAPGARESLSRAMAATGAIGDAPSHDREAQARAFTGIAQEQAAMGDEAGARQTLALAVVAANGLDEPHRRAAVLSAISAAHRRSNDEEGARRILSLALETAARIADKSSRAGMHINIARSIASIHSDDLRTAAEIIREAHGMGIRSSWDDYSGTSYDLARMAVALVDAGYVEDALRLAEMIGDEHDGDRSTVVARIAYALAAAGEAAAAWGTEERVRGGYSRVEVAFFIGLALARAGDTAGATKAAAKITRIEEEEWADSVYTEAIFSRSAIFTALVKAHAASGAFDKAHLALEEIERSSSKADAAAAIAEAQTATGDLGAALAPVRTACEYVRRGLGCVETLSRLAAAHDSVGDGEMARELLSEAWETAEWMRTRIWSGFETIQPYVALWRVQMRMGDVEGGRKAFATALDAANFIDYWPERVEELIALASAAAQTDDRTSARRAFSLAMKAAGDIENDERTSNFGDGYRAHVFKDIGKKRVQADDWRGAREAFAQALVNAARLAEDDGARALLFRDVALALNLAPDGAMPGDDDR